MRFSLLSSSVSLLSLVWSVSCASSPPSGSITVGKGGKYTTLSAALKDTSSDTYFVYAGSYKEQVVINRANVRIYGQTSDALTYAINQATITNNVPASQAGSNDASGTVRVLATGVRIYNLNIANTYGKPVSQSQAIALSVQAGQFGCYGCKLTGAVDFIFGQQASIWITGSTLNTIGNGYITASGRSSADSAYYVIDKCTITGSGKQYLGRPWRNYARVVVQNTDIGSHIDAAGWSVWSSSTPNTDHVLFGEYNNSGSGAWKSGPLMVGNGGKYSTLSAALKDTSSNVYFVYAGTYKDQVAISRANVKIYGQTSNALTYSSNQATITNNIPASSAGSNDASGTVRVLATGVSIYNLNIANTYGKPVDQSQAIALSVQAGQFGCYGCKLTGYQDTLLANKGTQFYGKSYIEGAVDFIFGQQASIWITGSTINTIANGYITASGRSSGDSNYYVIDKSSITGTGTQYLGRPWRNYARVVVQGTSIGSHVVAAGWSQWSSSTPNTDHILFGEYNNSGGGAWRTGRASFATKLSAGVSISTALGSTSWIDSAYL
ncbi:unnamed protein product [Rhizoctonia solani]|uniref:Pectinesterase n=1 Tax=Rhizoctonia solani TaxID=456999 RepID=A0A8H3ALS3_9AGAM|nr:unnamed protein product [Rhizoctonia solani]